ncbi:LPD7 domain-containing protein [Sphingomonas sp. 3P27F8]|uniref:relaxase/mobilization nuclease domain-containing protein n=1 Tax=Sphingomonas sp. 3P27F8 TaxID=2502213 RepID=UPI0010F8FC57|nr:LPD7 domain-containing protein [Sphingomonas sp. 3P27F8]
MKRARQAGIELAIHRVTSEAVGGHIVALTMYLISPTKARLDELAAIEAAKNHVVRYIGSIKPSDEVTAADIEAAREIAQGERVVQIVSRNLLSTDIADVQFEMAVVAGIAPGSEDPIEHIVVSWPEGEHPTPDQIEEVLDIVLAVTGMSRHQAYAVLHGDTQNDHLHIALNRVDPVTGERVAIGRDIERSIETLHQAIAIIEHRQGWVPQDNALYRADDTGCYDRETGTKVRDADMMPCASNADRSKIRQWRAEQKIERKISAAARDFERRTGIESLQRRVIKMAAPIFREARDWTSVHRDLATEGMRYEMLNSGAVIVCGDRRIAASTAWGGASAAKMLARLGEFEEAAPAIAFAPFEDRLIPKLHEAAEKRRALAALRHSKAVLDASAAHARTIVGDRYRDLVADDPLADTEALNEVRQRASAEVTSLKQSIELLELQQRVNLRRKRAALNARRRTEADEVADEPVGMLISTILPAKPPAVSPDLEGYDIVESDGRRDYYAGRTLAFSEHRDRINIHTKDDAALRQALRLAQSKWGSVAAIGDDRFLDRVARLAVEEGITITNPELQERMLRLQNNRDLAGQLDAIEAHQASPAIDQAPSAEMPAVSTHDVLKDYAPEFAAWLALRDDPSVPRGKVDASAYTIYVSPELKRELAELESQQFAFAIELRRAARRYVSLLQEIAAPFEPAIETRELADLERLPLWPGQRLSDPKLAEMVQFAPLPKQVPTQAVDDPDRVTARDVDRRYREWADRQQAKLAKQARDDRAAALRARAGDPLSPPRHIARLLLREAARAGAARSPYARDTDWRDRQETAALRYDPEFARMLEQARHQDAALLAMLRSAEPDGDPLGRVIQSRGHLDFTHASSVGHDPGAMAPLEWIEDDLRRIDFTRVRLTRDADGFIGLADPDVLDATHHNHVALLYPDVQVRLEVEWRLQCERDVAVLGKIHRGEIAIEVSVDLTNRAHVSAGIPRRATDDERHHIAAMMRDPDAVVAVREATRGAPPAETPLHPLPMVAAYLRAAREDDAGATVLAMLMKQVETKAPEFARSLPRKPPAERSRATSSKPARGRGRGTPRGQGAGSSSRDGQKR